MPFCDSLIVEFANQLRDKGYEVKEAILEGASLRFRPVLMTTISTVFGAVPLVIATGAGAESRAAIGMVILGGLIFATTLTLFIIPVLYNLLARFAKSSNAVEQELERRPRVEGATEAGPRGDFVRELDTLVSQPSAEDRSQAGRDRGDRSFAFTPDRPFGVYQNTDRARAQGIRRRRGMADLADGCRVDRLATLHVYGRAECPGVVHVAGISALLEQDVVTS